MATFLTNPPASALDGSETVPITQGGVDKKTTAQDIADLGAGGIETIVAGVGIAVDATDPANPIVSVTGGGGGASIGVQYTSDTGSTADSDPGPGLLKWNNATQASATVVFLDDTTGDGVSMTGFWSAFDAGGLLYLQDKALQDTWQIWEITTVTDASGYVKLAVTLLAKGNDFADDSDMLVTLQQGASGGGGGVTGFTTALNTSSPNNTNNVSSMKASGGTSRQDVAIVGNGGSNAWMRDIPDGSSSGGNVRGANAFDGQNSRNSNTQVASGAASVILGGQQNTASGGTSIAGGNASNASATDAIAIGLSAAASSPQSVVIGGQSGSASATGAAVIGGRENQANGNYSVAMGMRATTRGVQCSTALGVAFFTATRGDAQAQTYPLGAQTTSATPVRLCTDNSGSGGTNNQVVLANNSDYVVKGAVTARQGTTGDAAKWEFTACIRRGANAAATVMDVTCTPVSLYAASGASTWTLTVNADTTNGALAITGTGEISKSIGWMCHVYSCAQVVG